MAAPVSREWTKQMKRLLTTATVAAGAMFFQLPAYATPGGSIKDTWAIGVSTGDKPTNITGTLPTLTLSKTTTSNDGQITPVTDTDTQNRPDCGHYDLDLGLRRNSRRSGAAKRRTSRSTSRSVMAVPERRRSRCGWITYANFSTDKDGMFMEHQPDSAGLD